MTRNCMYKYCRIELYQLDKGGVIQWQFRRDSIILSKVMNEACCDVLWKQFTIAASCRVKEFATPPYQYIMSKPVTGWPACKQNPFFLHDYPYRLLIAPWYQCDIPIYASSLFYSLIPPGYAGARPGSGCPGPFALRCIRPNRWPYSRHA